MNLPFFISRKLTSGDKDLNRLSKPVINIATGGIVIGIIAMMITVFIVRGFQKEVRERAVAFGGHIQIIKNSVNNSDETLPIKKENKVFNNLKNIEEIKNIQYFTTKNGIIKTKTENEGVVVKGVGDNYQWGFIAENILEGKIIDPKKDSAQQFAMISKITSDRLNLKCGDPLFIYFILTDSLVKITKESTDTIVSINGEAMKKWLTIEENQRPDTMLILKYNSRVKKFIIKSIYETGIEEFDKKIVFTSENYLKKICKWNPHLTGGVEILIKDYDKLDEVAFLVGNIISEDINLSSYTIKENNPGIFEWLEMHDTTAWIIIILMIVVAIINMISALIILIIEKTNMIGTLKTLGMNNKKIIMIFIYQALRIILRGLITGNLLGIGLAFIQEKIHLFKLDQSTYYMSYIPIKFEWSLLLFLNLGTLFICLFFMLFPCILISKTSPIKAIRFN